MATGSGDDNFDWVSAQAGCSVEQMFQKLQDGARADVERRNGATFGRKDDWRFEFHPDLTFFREGSRIEITGEGIDVQITAIVGINPHGDCRYYVGEGEFLGWEVRKQALDLLFFEDAED